MYFAILIDPRVKKSPQKTYKNKSKKKKKKKRKLRPSQRTEKVMKHEGDGGTNWIWKTWNGPQKLGIRIG